MAEPAPRVEGNPDTAFEPSDWPLGPVGLILLGIFVFLVAAPLVLVLAYPRAVSDVGRRLLVEAPPPRLQVDPSDRLAKFLAAEKAKLDGYYWVDKQKGIVHIPIEQAMRKLAAEGIDGFPRGKR